MFGKRIFIVIMVVILFFVPVRNCYAAAEAATLTVVGGSIAAGGIGAALVAVAPVALVVAGIALAAQGIYVFLTDDSIESGKTNMDFLGEKLEEFCAESGRSYAEYCRTLVDGSSIKADGKMVLTETASGLISQFINSLTADDEIETEANFTSKSIVVNGVTCPVIGMNDYVLLGRYVLGGDSLILRMINNSDTNVGVFSYFTESGKQRVAMISESTRVDIVVKDQSDISRGGTGALNDVENGIRYSYYSGMENYLVDNYLPVINDFPECLNEMNGFTILQGLGEDSFITDNLTNVDGNVYNPAEGNVNVIDTGLNLGDIAQDYGKSGTITIENYLDSLRRALEGVESNTIAINDSLTGVLENVGVGVYNPSDVASVSEEDKDTAYAGVITPVIDASLNPSGVNAENALKGMQFDLTGIFPFCIPFDLFALIQKFDVQPETPNVHLVIPLGGISEDLVLDLDFSPFETVAQVLRTMELIAFVVGLAMVTRSMIRG